MTIRQTAFNPLPHSHDFKDIPGIRTALFGEESRTVAPACEFRSTAEFSIVGNAKAVAMGANFAAWTDTDTMFKKNTDSGTGAGYARVVIPVTGRYDILWQAYIDTARNNGCTAIVTLNGTNADTQAICSNVGASFGWSNPQAHTSRKLNTGDILYFHLWSPENGYVRRVWQGAAATSGIIRWVGPY